MVGYSAIRGTVAPGATIDVVGDPADEAVRTFKTAWFAKAARKAHLTDEELCSAVQQLILGQADDLGGGVFKKRLGRNQYRSIILARAGHFWVLQVFVCKAGSGKH